MEKRQLGKNKYSIRYSRAFKLRVCEAYLQSSLTKREIWKKFTGNKEEHGSLLKWLRELGYEKYDQKPIFAIEMKNKEAATEPFSEDTIALQQKIKLLERQLEEEKLKSLAYSTMIDIAEKELKISIRKK